MSWPKLSKEVGWEKSSRGNYVPPAEVAWAVAEKALKGDWASQGSLLRWNRFCEVSVSNPMATALDQESMRVIVAGLQAVRPIVDEDRPPFEEVEWLAWRVTHAESGSA